MISTDNRRFQLHGALHKLKESLSKQVPKELNYHSIWPYRVIIDAPVQVLDGDSNIVDEL